MECSFGITGPGYCILAADTTVARSIVVMKPGETKFRSLTPRSMLCFSGEPGDAANFADYVQHNIRLEMIRREGRGEVGVAETAACARKALADSLRSRTPYNVNLLIGGVEEGAVGGGSGMLYWMDYLASMVRVPHGAHGYGAYFCSGLMDRLYREGMSEEEALELLRKCLSELKTRFIVNLPEFHVKIIRANGTVESRTMIAEPY